jgi:hypothetical protein
MSSSVIRLNSSGDIISLLRLILERGAIVETILVDIMLIVYFIFGS